MTHVKEDGQLGQLSHDGGDLGTAESRHGTHLVLQCQSQPPTSMQIILDPHWLSIMQLIHVRESSIDLDDVCFSTETLFIGVGHDNDDGGSCHC